MQVEVGNGHACGIRPQNTNSVIGCDCINLVLEIAAFTCLQFGKTSGADDRAANTPPGEKLEGTWYCRAWDGQNGELDIIGNFPGVSHDCSSVDISCVATEPDNGAFECIKVAQQNVPRLRRVL